MSQTNLLTLINWRYATKKMDPAKSVSQDKVDAILEAIRMAPTSSGTQPFEVLEITNAEIREQIQPVAWNQAQITEGSHLLVFAAWDNYTTERIDQVVALATDLRGDLPLLNQYYDNLKATYLPRDAGVNLEHAARQAYIALGIAMVAAAELQVDCTPMEGFDPAQVDEIFGLNKRGLRSVVLLPLGYRQAEADWLVNMPKVRKSTDTMIRKIS